MSLIKSLKTKYYELFLGEERSREILSNVIKSLVIKGISIVATLLLIPVSIHYINKDLYGVWLTISSVIIWMGIFDLGLTNGLRNSITQSLVSKNERLARIYISTTYAIMLAIIIPLWLCFQIILREINWQKVFNTNLSNSTLITSLRIVFTSFCCSFVLKPFVALLMAVQKHFLISLFQCISNVFALLVIIFFGNKNPFHFVFLSAVLSLSQPFVLLIASLVMFRRNFSLLTPSLKQIDLAKWKILLGVGIKFFIIQLSVLIIYSSDNIIISQLLDNNKVTDYNIILRYFSIVTIFYALIMSPFWTACNDAYHKGDYSWLKITIKKLNTLCLLLCAGVGIMLFFSNNIYKIWIGNTIKLPFFLSFLIALYVSIGLFKETYVTFINGTGKINLQIIYSLISCVFHIPMAYILIKYFDLGLAGLVYVNIFWFLIAAILWRYQFYKVAILKANFAIWH